MLLPYLKLSSVFLPLLHKTKLITTLCRTPPHLAPACLSNISYYRSFPLSQGSHHNDFLWMLCSCWTLWWDVPSWIHCHFSENFSWLPVINPHTHGPWVMEQPFHFDVFFLLSIRSTHFVASCSSELKSYKNRSLGSVRCYIFHP